METQKRTLVKALSWQSLGLLVTGLIGWYFTGSLTGSIGVALSSSLSGFVCYFLHERLWQRIPWGLAAKVEG